MQWIHLKLYFNSKCYLPCICLKFYLVFLKNFRNLEYPLSVHLLCLLMITDASKMYCSTIYPLHHCSYSYKCNIKLVYLEFLIILLFNYGITTEMEDISLTTHERVQVELLPIPHCTAIIGVVAAMLLVAIIVIQTLVVVIVIIVIRLR